MKIIQDYNRAGYPVLYVLTSEPARLERETPGIMARWDSAAGWRTLSAPGATHQEPAQEMDPAAAIQRACQLLEAIVHLENAHHYLDNPIVSQTLLNALPQLKSQGTTILISAPLVKIPAELTAQVRVLDHDLPNAEALGACLDQILPQDAPAITDDDRQAILASGAGMTLSGFEDAAALSLVRRHHVDPTVIWQEKADAIKKSGGAEIYKGDDRFDQIGGLDAVKSFMIRSLTGRPGARGVLLLGVPGTGKSALAKALGNEVGRCTISLDLGRMFQSLVGESERMIRETLKIVDRMAPSILFIDEIEKGLAGMQSSGKTDGGTGSRVFGTLLTWLNDHTSDTYIVATCNDISAIPPEFLRQERWDGIFFVDQPTYEEREKIWELYKAKYELTDQEHPTGQSSGWTGAEIKSACRLAYIQQIPLAEAARQVIPLSVSAAARILEIRARASGTCLSATTGGIYSMLGDQQAQTNPAPSRRINTTPNTKEN